MSTFDQIHASAELQAVAQEVSAGARAMLDSLDSILSGDDDGGGDPAQLLDQSMAEFKAWFDRGAPLWNQGKTLASSGGSAPASEPSAAPTSAAKAFTKLREEEEMSILTIQEHVDLLINSRAEQLQKEDPSLTRSQAVVKVLDTPDGKGMYSAYWAAGKHGTFTDREAVKYAKLALEEAAGAQAARRGDIGEVQKGFSELPMCTALMKRLEGQG